jgi:hypothetical protein
MALPRAATEILRSLLPATVQLAGTSSSRTTWSPGGMLLRVNTPAFALTVPSTPAGSMLTLKVNAFADAAPVVVTPTVTVPRAPVA